jgi:7 transmembrane helices usually fused to an inactive transglutaminase/Inactive transglutaminase fused to 7 transmembrane helices
MKRLQATILALLVSAAALGLMYAKISRLGLPLLPNQLQQVWLVEAKIEFEASRRATVVDFDIPDKLGEFVRLDEYFISRGYGLNVGIRDNDRRAEWSTRQARGAQRLYYRLEAVPQSEDESAEPPKQRALAPPIPPAYEEPLASAIQDTLGDVRDESANVFTFVSQTLVKLNALAPSDNIMIIRENLDRASEPWVERLIYVLAGASINARMVRGVILEDRTASQNLTPWLEVHNGTRWEGFDPQTGNRGYPENFMRWSVGGEPLLHIEGGRNDKVSFSVSRYAQSPTTVARARGVANDTLLASTMLFNLPVNTQNVYRVLLMVPFGALVVAFMRTIVGLPTLGTFMPILVAIAFRETELAWGIALFLLITSAGLSLRFYLERLQLLLVPRLCSVLVLVVLLMVLISLASARLGIDKGFSIALFPIVILTMVIERMSVIWEESGPSQALKEGLGSLSVAILGYLVMKNEYLTHLVFLFPESLLILLAVFIMMGRYTGYRLLEVARFKDIVEAPTSDVKPHT